MKIEHWWYTAPLRLKSIFRRRRVENELDEEMQFHLDLKIEEGIAEGLSPEDARYRALRAMGGLDQKKEEIRDARRVHWLTDFIDDVRYAVRSLRRTPGLTAIVVVTIALGIGMTATPLSMLDALIFRPYPVPHPGEVVTLVSTTRDNGFESFSYREYLDIRDRTKSYDGVIANAPLSTVGFSAEREATPLVRGGMLVSGNYFRALGVEPLLGRGFRTDEDEAPGRDAVVVLSWDFWQREFAGAPSAVGRVVRLNGKDFTIIGVAPETFTGLYIFDRPDFYIPLAMARVFSASPQKDFFTDRDDRGLTVRGRLAPGATLRQAQNELAVVARDFEREYPRVNRERGAAVRTMFQMRTQDGDANWKFSVIFTTLALAVLLVACTNAAGLLLSRARSRTREIAIRLAIGAGRLRLIRLLLTESLVLALLGGLGGIAVGYLGIRAMQTFSIPAELPVKIPFRMDGRMLLASLALSVLSALFCGLAPALQSTRTNLVRGLRAADGDEPGGGRKRLWGRNALVVAQIAMSLMLLAASFLMIRGFQHSIGEEPDYARDHLLMVRFDPRLAQYDAGQTRRFYEQLAERARKAPGVVSAAFTRNPPRGLGDFDRVAFVPEAFQMPRDRERFTSTMDTIDEGFFETMGVPILRGRGFRASDNAAAPLVAVVNEQFAKHYWPGADAVGKRIRLDGAEGAPVEIVGIARTIKYSSGPRLTGEDFVYMPLAQHPVARMVLLLKSSGDPLQLIKPVKEVVRALDANMPMLETRSYEDLYRYATVEGPRVAVEMVGTLGAVGLLLAIAGLYGLVAYNVSRRTREIGIRIAIGATSRDVVRLMMGKGLVLVGTGTVIGLVMGFGLERFMNSMLFDAGGVDLVVYLVIVPAMFLVTMLAAYLPARKAARIPPTLALRCE
jgi:macrolide transport system ATP-binding/permease protein